jgi:hypothetical protein
VLLVGESFQSAHALTDWLRRCGFRCHFASSMRTACQLLSSVEVDVVLSHTRLPDGTGFGLLGILAGLPVAAFLCLPVENSCFWLPAVDAGRDCLGLPALWPSEFENTLEEMAQCAGAHRFLSA